MRLKIFQPCFNRFNRISTEPGNFWRRLNSFWMPNDLVSLFINRKQFELTLRGQYLGAGDKELDNLTPQELINPV
jgi:hypothetical protein